MPEATPLHRRALAPAAAVLAALVPFWKLCLGRGVIVPDDVGLSDFFDAEFPVRVALGRMLKAGQAPVWCPDVLSGMPLVGVSDPLSVLFFWLLPPVWAVNAVVLSALMIAALGGHRLGRRAGMLPWASALTGFSFAWSGYMVCQLRHISITQTVCWAPLALSFLLDALSLDASPRRSARAAVGFAATLGMQVAAGFPQSVYILGLAYAVVALALATRLPRRDALARLGTLALGGLPAVLVGMYQLLPLWEYGTLSSRHADRGFAWATRFNYHPEAALTFLVPYFYGDAGRNDYRLGIFWEEFGYVGLAPLALSVYALARGVRTRLTQALLAIAVLSFVMVLGKHTPVFELTWRLLPGLKTFRFSTRFLVVTDLALCTLGGLGLTALVRDLTPRLSARAAAALAPAVFVLTVANLWWVQTRQNPIADAESWLTPPSTARAVAREPGTFRVYTLDDKTPHVHAYTQAHGWSDLRPLHAARDFLAPDTNILWGITTAGGYAGLYTRTAVAVWGGHTDEVGLAQRTTEHRTLSPAFFRLLAMHNVRFLLTEGAIEHPLLTRVPVASEAPVGMYRLRDTLPRAWWVPSATLVHRNAEAEALILSPDFNPARTAIVHAAALPPMPEVNPNGSGDVTLRQTAPDALTLDVQSDAAGWMVLSDGFYPGWEAEVDGRPARVYRANLNSRAVALPAGRHRVQMTFAAPAFALGWRLSVVGVALLALAAWLTRRLSDDAHTDTTSHTKG